MKSKERQLIFLNILGIFFIILGILAITNSLFIKNPLQIFWMCYISLILIGIGILTRNTFIIMAQVYILAIPVLLWDIDFIYYLIFQEPLWGLTNYFFLERAVNLGKIISLQHLYAVPLALYATRLIGLKRRDAWKWSFTQIILVYIAVTLFTTPETNINCVFEPCINIYLGLPYRLTWFIIFFSLTLITSLIIDKTLFKSNFFQHK